MSPLQAVPVFYLSQDSELEQPCEFVSRDEARARKRAGIGWFIDHGKAFRMMSRAPEVAVPDKRKILGSVETSATISLSEMRANVGLCDEGVRNPRETVRRARAKVRLYPHIFDFLAPAARCYDFASLQA